LFTLTNLERGIRIPRDPENGYDAMKTWRWITVAAAMAVLAFLVGSDDRLSPTAGENGEVETTDTQTDRIEVFSQRDGGIVSRERVVRSEEEWKSVLDRDEYRVLREKGTERAFTGKYWDNKKEGIYRCAGCGNDLFLSSSKYDSGTGWPSFHSPVAEENLATETDRSLFMTRTEVLCPVCGGHLGHVFDDGPRPTGLRYCINSVSLEFEPASSD
jgi:peptide-methionine (R)-S-oxide reductase